MMPEWLFDALQFMIAFAGMAIAGIWRLSRVESTISDKLTRLMDTQKQEFIHEMQKLRDKYDVELNMLRNGDSRIEIWARDEFVRQREFYPIVESIKNDIRMLGDKIDAKMIRIEEKIDKLGEE
jgi:hypothetical protein